jgi:hypothetical protein
MRSLTKVVLVAAGALTFAATSASAEIVCNREGECWHIHGRADFYKREHGVHVYPDSWKWGKHEHYKWHEHEGHGYWKSGIWIGL